MGLDRAERPFFIQVTACHSHAPSGHTVDNTRSCSRDVLEAAQSPGQKLFAMFSELFRRGVLATPSAAESRCRRLRQAAEQTLPVGPIVISAEQAETAIRGVCEALLQAGHAAPCFEASGLESTTTPREAEPRQMNPAEERSVTERLAATPAAHPCVPPEVEAEVSVRGILRQRSAKTKGLSRVERARLRLGDSIYKETVTVRSWKALREELWTNDPVTQVTCDDCGVAVAPTNGKLHGGRSYFSRDTFSCLPCLHQRGLTESQLPPLLVENVATGHTSLTRCMQCQKDIMREEARYWNDRKGLLESVEPRRPAMVRVS